MADTPPALPDTPDGAIPRTVSPWLVRAAGWLAAAALLGLLFYRTPVSTIVSAVASADRTMLGVAALIALASEVFAASMKYKHIVAWLGVRLPLRETIVLRMGSYPLRNLLPFKSGEIVRLGYLKLRHGMPLARGALAAVLDPLADAVVLGLAAALGIALRGSKAAIGAALAVTAAGAVLIVLWPRLTRRLDRRYGDQGTGRDVEAHLAKLRSIAAWTCVVVAVDLLAFGLVLRAFGVIVPVARMALLVPVIVVASSLPLTPMGLGVRESVLLYLMAPYGRPEALLASALLVSTIMKLVPTAFGIPFVRPLMRRMLAPA